MKKKKMYVIGAGMGDVSQITRQGINTLQEMEVIYAYDRIASLYKGEYPEIIPCSYSLMMEKLREAVHEKVGVLVSGDVGFYSMASTLHKYFGEQYYIENIPGINSMQYLCSKLGISYESIHLLSLHGRDAIAKLLGAITYQEHTFLLTGGIHHTRSILEYLSDKIDLDVQITIGESLSMEGERIITGNIKELLEVEDYGTLSVMLISNEKYSPKNKHYRDEAFTRSSVPMSKRDVRSLSIDYLDIQPEDIVYDIGAGTGSVSIELASFAYTGMVYGIEKNPVAYETVLENKKKFRSFNFIPVLGDGLEESQKLPVPDKAFIGGSSGELPEIVEQLLERNPQVELLITAITLETVSQALEIMKSQKMDYEITCVNSSSSRKLGTYNLMTANNPIYLIWGRRNDGNEQL